MKIYEIGTGYTPIPAQMGAATEIVVEELTRAFLSKGQDVEIIDIAAEHRAETDLPVTEVKVPAVFQKADVKLGLMHKMKRVAYSVALAFKLKELLRQDTEQTVLHFHNQYNLFFFLKLVNRKERAKVKIAYTVHSYIWGTDWNRIEETVRKRYFQEIHCVQNADLVLVLNDITIEHFVTRLGVDKNRIYRVRNGVNVEHYIPLPDEQVATLKHTNHLDGKRVIFQVGSVCDRKNQLGTIRMLSDYLKTHPEAVYLYAGGIVDTDYYQTIVKYVSDNRLGEQIRYVGELTPGEQLNQYYNMSDCCVFTSTLESFGLVIIEAISAGTPVVLGSDLMFDLHAGYTTGHNTDEFVMQVDAALNSHHNPESFRKAVNPYGWESVAEMHLKLFEG